MKSLLRRCLGTPSQTINLPNGEPYLERWYLIPRNRFMNIYLHCFLHSDDERALHDHPWASVSFLLKGKLSEVTDYHYPHFHTGVFGAMRFERRMPWLRPVFRSAKFAHRLVVDDGPVWTLFITGPKVREWGFLTPDGWVHWRDYHSLQLYLRNLGL